ncbi:uncharacterized protein LOC135695944 [Rhopilema esculentum]|uniref:uncharacterized protein LOC135695944 n=1 Tax=Rhopilema esculentum TaxID=499914 RepID=UPI0031E3BD53
MAGSAAAELRNFVRICKKIVCVGRNYIEHVAELGNTVPEKPLIFLKPTTSFLEEGQGNIKVPPGCSELHHEVELAIIIGKDGKNIEEANAMNHVGGYALALDMTARNLQNDAKKKGIPWTLAKAWDTFCPISKFLPADAVPNPQDVHLWLKVENQIRQDGNTKDMIFHIPKLINYISGVMTLNVGDVILTGTPSGVSPVKSGETIEAGLGEQIKMKFMVE